MQQTGGGVSEPVGARVNNALARTRQMQARMESDRQRADDVHAQIEHDRAMNTLEMAQRNMPKNISPLDVGDAIHDFAFEDIPRDATNISRGLIDLVTKTPDTMLSGEAGTPMDIAKAVGTDYYNRYRDPSYMLHNPLTAAMDIGGAAMGLANAPTSIGGVLDDALMTGRTALTPSLDELAGAAYPRAIGPMGKIFEDVAGRGDNFLDTGAALENLSDPELMGGTLNPDTPSMLLGSPSTASPPNFGLATADDVSGFALMKPGEDINASGWVVDQVNPQLAYQDLWNRVGLGEDLPKPGSAAADFEYYPYYKKPGTLGTKPEDWNVRDPEVTSGLVTEYVPGAMDVKAAVREGLIDPKSAKYAQDIEDTAVMDIIAGNSDRSIAGQNMMYRPDVDRLMPIDEGMAFKTAGRFEGELPTKGGWTGLIPTEENMPGLQLSPRSRQILETAYAELNQTLDPEHHTYTYDPLYETVGADELGFAMDRISQMLDKNTLLDIDPNKTMYGWLDAFDDLEQPGDPQFPSPEIPSAEIFNPQLEQADAPPWVQLMNAIQEGAKDPRTVSLEEASIPSSGSDWAAIAANHSSGPGLNALLDFLQKLRESP